MPVYKVVGRDPEEGRTSEELCEALKKRGLSVDFSPDIKSTLDRLTGEVVVFMGAGSIDQQVRGYFKWELLPV